MKEPFRQVQLYTFLRFCERQGLPKDVLDCGSGGDSPPLALFLDYGYSTQGIDVDDDQIEAAHRYEAEHGIKLNIVKGDMRSLPFPDAGISYIYSYNTVFHMPKKEIRQSIDEIHRVLRPGGLCFINFASTQDMRYGEGEAEGPGEFRQTEGDSMVLHSYHDAEETDQYFARFKILFRENRLRSFRTPDDQWVHMGLIDYVVEKPRS